MKRDQFLRSLRHEAKEAGLTFRIDQAAGKGGHYRVHLGSRASTVKSGDLKPGYMKLIRGQLGLK